MLLGSCILDNTCLGRNSETTIKSTWRKYTRTVCGGMSYCASALESFPFPECRRLNAYVRYRRDNYTAGTIIIRLPFVLHHFLTTGTQQYGTGKLLKYISVIVSRPLSSKRIPRASRIDNKHARLVHGMMCDAQPNNDWTYMAKLKR